MNGETHWFWWLLTWASLIWYSTITLYVAYRGVADVKQLLRRLARSGVAEDIPPTLYSNTRDS